MKEKLIKAYWTAWRWPEVHSDSKDVIWISRVLAVAIPVFLVILTFLIGVASFGVVLSAIMAVFVGVGLIVLTVSAFYEEYPTVEDFEAREAAIKDFFIGFPSITDVPVIEDHTDEWIAYGHIDKSTFLDAIARVIFRVTEDGDLADYFIGKEDQVEYLYARFNSPQQTHWKDGITFCSEHTKDCFPITRIEKYEPDN